MYNLSLPFNSLSQKLQPKMPCKKNLLLTVWFCFTSCKTRRRFVASRTFTHRTLAHNWYLLMPVKSIGLFKTLFFLPCVPGLMADHIRFVVLFSYYLFFLGRLSLLSCIFTCNPSFYYLKNSKLIFVSLSIWVNLHNKVLQK